MIIQESKYDLNINNSIIIPSVDSVTLLDIEIGIKLNFEKRVSTIISIYIFLSRQYPSGRYMFVKYSWSIPIIYSQNIRKKFLIKFRGIFPNNVPGMLFVEYSWNIPMIYSQNIRKNFSVKFREIFPNNILEILNIGIFPYFSMNILQTLHAFF